MNLQCSQCGKSGDMTTLLRCGRCRGVLYCDKQCQKMDWSTHKKNCRNQTPIERRLDNSMIAVIKQEETAFALNTKRKENKKRPHTKIIFVIASPEDEDGLAHAIADQIIELGKKDECIFCVQNDLETNISPRVEVLEKAVSEKTQLIIQLWSLSRGVDPRPNPEDQEHTKKEYYNILQEKAKDEYDLNLIDDRELEQAYIDINHRRTKKFAKKIGNHIGKFSLIIYIGYPKTMQLMFMLPSTVEMNYEMLFYQTENFRVFETLSKGKMPSIKTIKDLF